MVQGGGRGGGRGRSGSRGNRGGRNGQNNTRGVMPSHNNFNGSGSTGGWGAGMSEEEINAHLPERFRGGARQINATNEAFLPHHGNNMKLNMDIRHYVRNADAVMEAASPGWLSQPEVPTSSEVLLVGDDEVMLPPNKIDGPWRNKDKYLKSHYTLLREDAVSPLRDAVDMFRQSSEMSEGDNNVVSIYEKVHIAGFTFAPLGIAARIRFSTTRVGKAIPWKYSKRLLAGTMVALSPAKDKFRSKCVIAIVAARPMAGVEDNPPQIDIYFGCSEDIEIDPQQEWTMLEAKQGYFEAARHTLRALQKLSSESFPLSKQICTLSTDLEAPSYVLSKPNINLQAAFGGKRQQTTMQDVNILQDWPAAPEEALDKSQWAAMQQILTKRLSIIQGPPGTGKTYVSKVALQILAENRTSGDPPIIVAAQTNHALDQLLGHVAKFDPDYIRLGGRSTKPEIKKQALYEIRQRERLPVLPGGLLGKANVQMKAHIAKMLETLSPLNRDEARGPLSAQTMFELGILTQAQKDSLENGAKQWVTAGDLQSEGAVQLWLNKALIPFQVVYKQDNFGFEEEEVDLEYEQVTELQAEMGVTDDEDTENLRGPWCSVDDRCTVAKAGGVVLKMAEELLQKTSDLWKVKENLRGPMYGILQEKAKAIMLNKFREQAKIYEALVRDLKVGKWERDATYLEKANFIGMTTTGLSKYRALVASLKPKIILIEEAAEVIEAPVTAACVDSLEHLILVGDHQQLQGHCNIQELGVEPYNLNVSMFERLVRNNMPYKTLLRQRRMDPEFRRLLYPIYPKLEDHPDVLGRAALPVGLGTVKSFFFDHEYPEYKDSQLSSFNDREAEFIAGFYHYLLQNSADPQGITILTFYNGQRKRILSHVKSRPQTAHHYVNVVTVDSYQGEENGIVILSLVRNNDRGDIGFLKVDNRVCVALSRARMGFYIFGNTRLLAASSPLWSQVINIMGHKPNRIGDKFPIICKKHDRETLITYPGDWENYDGGCDQPCTDSLPCGHLCTLKCHPYPHDTMTCLRPCKRILPCSHTCTKLCSEHPCFCSCDEFAKGIIATHREPPEDERSSFNQQPFLANRTADNIWSAVSTDISKKHNGRPSHIYDEQGDDHQWAIMGTIPFPNKEVRGNNNWGRMGTSSFPNNRGRGNNHRHDMRISPQQGQIQPSSPTNHHSISYAVVNGGDSSANSVVKTPPLPTTVPVIQSALINSGSALHTPSNSSDFGFGFGKGSQHSPEKQIQGRGEWTNYAAGGFKVDDEMRDKHATQEARLVQEQQIVEASLIDLGNEGCVKYEKVVEMKNGRKKFTQEYQPPSYTPTSYQTSSISGASASGQSTGNQSLLDLSGSTMATEW